MPNLGLGFRELRGSVLLGFLGDLGFRVWGVKGFRVLGV